MPASRALFTRVTGPGMVHPTVTAAIDEPAASATTATPGKAATPGKRGKRGKVELTANASVGAASGRAAFDPSYPWEKRAWTPLDFYAGGRGGGGM